MPATISDAVHPLVRLFPMVDSVFHQRTETVCSCCKPPRRTESIAPVHNCPQEQATTSASNRPSRQPTALLRIRKKEAFLEKPVSCRCTGRWTLSTSTSSSELVRPLASSVNHDSDEAGEVNRTGGSGGQRLLGGTSRAVCLLETTMIRMVTKDARIKTSCILAILVVFHEANRRTKRVLQMLSPTYFRIWKTPLIADRVVGHAARNSIPLSGKLSLSHRQIPATPPLR
jgi:hypothetical protein